MDNEKTNFKSAAELATFLGRKSISSHVGVTIQQVSNAVIGGQFPSSWFVVLDAMCRDRGQECPRSLFKFKEFKADAE